MTKIDVKTFKRKIYTHYKKHGRDLPWRKTTNAYRIVVSEIMLQQTQVDRVLPKYKQFIKTFPNFKMLAQAPLRDVLFVWQGLGYNRRAKMLHDAAKTTMIYHSGTIPASYEKLVVLPGIGDYTARAVLVFAHNKPEIMIETNIRTVFLHHFFPKTKKVNDKDILPLIEETLDQKNPRMWYGALMDYGAMLKKEYPNPSRRSAHHTKQSRFEGSDRQIRGTIVKALVEKKKVTETQLIQTVGREPKRIREQLKKLKTEGFIKKQKNIYRVA